MSESTFAKGPLLKANSEKAGMTRLPPGGDNNEDPFTAVIGGLHGRARAGGKKYGNRLHAFLPDGDGGLVPHTAMELVETMERQESGKPKSIDALWPFGLVVHQSPLLLPDADMIRNTWLRERHATFRAGQEGCVGGGLISTFAASGSQQNKVRQTTAESKILEAQACEVRRQLLDIFGTLLRYFTSSGGRATFHDVGRGAKNFLPAWALKNATQSVLR